MRVPPLFVIDEILKLGLGLTDIQYDLPAQDEKLDKTVGSGQNYSTGIQYDPVLYRFVLISFARLLLSTLGKFKDV